MNEHRRIAKIFLDVKPGEHISNAIQRAHNEGCEYVYFNDQLYPTDVHVADHEVMPIVKVLFLRDVQAWREREADRLQATQLDYRQMRPILGREHR